MKLLEIWNSWCFLQGQLPRVLHFQQIFSLGYVNSEIFLTEIFYDTNNEIPEFLQFHFLDLTHRLSFWSLSEYLFINCHIQFQSRYMLSKIFLSVVFSLCFLWKMWCHLLMQFKGNHDQYLLVEHLTSYCTSGTSICNLWFLII